MFSSNFLIVHALCLHQDAIKMVLQKRRSRGSNPAARSIVGRCTLNLAFESRMFIRTTIYLRWQVGGN